MHILAISPIN